MILSDLGISVGITSTQVPDNKGNGGESGIRIRAKAANKELNRAQLAISVFVSLWWATN
jgi:hypothetical protein